VAQGVDPPAPAAEGTAGPAERSDVSVGLLTDADRDDLFALFAEVVERREGFPHEPPLTPDAFDAVWSGSTTTAVGARVLTTQSSGAAPAPGPLIGAYYLRPNFAGRAAHVANAGYVVAKVARGRGIGRLLVEDSIQRAPLVGFDAIQFNLVFETNPARRLYEALGWREIGRVPRAVEGEDALIYWRPVG
jgi:GNAT superfamily N-acetyltransferase